MTNPALPPKVEIWDTLFGQTAPEILYHYTDQDGLVGILASREAWATHIRYMNDSREFRHAADIIGEWLDDQARTGAVVGPELDAMRTAVREAGNVSTFVFCLSEVPNRLSQWRAYGGPRGGFSIGFRPAALIGNRPGGVVTLGRCLYKHAEQRRLLDSWLRMGIEEMRNYAETFRAARDSGRLPADAPDEYDSLRMSFRSGLSRVAAMLKHRSFREEREWRIITQVHPGTRPPIPQDERVRVRSGPSLLKPYLRLHLTKLEYRDRPSTGPLAAWANEIAEIWVGPTRHRSLTAAAVDLALCSYGVSNCPVKVSRTPLRTS